MIISIALALVASAGPAPNSVMLVHKLDLTGSSSAPGWSASAYAVNPDTQTAAVQGRFIRSAVSRPPDASEPPRDEVALLDLRDGHTIASRPLSCLFQPQLAISRDGRTVVILRTLDQRMNSPYEISVWKPYLDPDDLKDYRLTAGSRQDGQGTLGRFGSFAGSPPVVSPDGTQVALFGRELADKDGSSDELYDNAIGVLDLETGKVIVMPVPVKTPAGPWQYWHLGWSSDGSSLYAVLHGTWSDNPRGALIQGKPAPLARRPDLTLYCFSLATKAATRVGLVPPTTCGFGPDDDIVVADTVREGWGPHRAYALLPISRVEEGQVASGAAGLAFVAGLTMRTPSLARTTQRLRRFGRCSWA